jgi:hypothetical protein
VEENTMTDKQTVEERLLEIEKRRQARAVKNEEAIQLRRLMDLEEIDLLEEKHGHANISVYEVPYSDDDTPVLLAVRTPRPVEIKRYRDTVRPDSEGVPGDTAKAAEDLGEVCCVYPAADMLTKIRTQRPGVMTQLGLASLGLGVAKAEKRGKD